MKNLLGISPAQSPYVILARKKNLSLWRWASIKHHKEATWYLLNNLVPGKAEKVFKFGKVEIYKVGIHIFINKMSNSK